MTATDPSTTVKEVTVLYTDGTNPGTWTPVTLTSTDGTTFTGSGPSTPSGQMQYVVQAVDADGNVAISSNKGAYFPAVPPQVAPTITSAALASFTVGAVGNFKVAASGTPAPTVALIGNLPAGLSFNASTGYLSGSPAEEHGRDLFTDRDGHRRHLRTGRHPEPLSGHRGRS